MVDRLVDARLKHLKKRIGDLYEQIDAADALTDGDEKIVAHDAVREELRMVLAELDSARLEAGR